MRVITWQDDDKQAGPMLETCSPLLLRVASSLPIFVVTPWACINCVKGVVLCMPVRVCEHALSHGVSILQASLLSRLTRRGRGKQKSGAAADAPDGPPLSPGDNQDGNDTKADDNETAKEAGNKKLTHKVGDL